MPALIPETSLPEAPAKESVPGLSFETEVFSSSELLGQPWLPQLTQAINEGFAANGGVMKFSQRLHSDTQLSEELGENGFTIVAYTTESGKRSSDCQEIDIIGTASVKDWLNDGQWQRYTHGNVGCAESGHRSEGGNGSLEQDFCDGDYEITVVTIRPDEKYRKRGIADHLVKACEKELLRQSSLREEGVTRPLRTMVKVVKDIGGRYWTKKGFTPVGQKRAPKGTWGSSAQFTMWAMVRELVPMASVG